MKENTVYTVKSIIGNTNNGSTMSFRSIFYKENLAIADLNMKKRDIGVSRGYESYLKDVVLEKEINKSIMFSCPGISSPYSPSYNTKGVIYLGSISRDCRCTGTDPYYCFESDYAKAMITFKEKSMEMKSRIDGYYSKPWV